MSVGPGVLEGLKGGCPWSEEEVTPQGNQVLSIQLPDPLAPPRVFSRHPSSPLLCPHPLLLLLPPQVTGFGLHPIA